MIEDDRIQLEILRVKNTKLEDLLKEKDIEIGNLSKELTEKSEALRILKRYYSIDD